MAESAALPQSPRFPRLHFHKHHIDISSSNSGSPYLVLALFVLDLFSTTFHLCLSRRLTHSKASLISGVSIGLWHVGEGRYKYHSPRLSAKQTHERQWQCMQCCRQAFRWEASSTSSQVRHLTKPLPHRQGTSPLFTSTSPSSHHLYTVPQSHDSRLATSSFPKAYTPWY